MVKRHTHHDATIEALARGNSDIPVMAFEHLQAGNHETIGMGVGGIESVAIGNLILGFLSESNTFVVVDLLIAPDSPVARLVASDVVTGNEDTVAWGNLARLDDGNITDEQFLDVTYHSEPSQTWKMCPEE